ncbi:MAG: MMPL family transporter [Gammaproteobacteria bacterium]|nr:MMPL family transporter [Gammaproteobacteria bacterium]
MSTFKQKRQQLISLYSKKINRCVLGFYIFLIAIFGYCASHTQFDISADAIALKRDLQSSAYQKANLYFNDDEQILVIFDGIKPFSKLQTINGIVHKLDQVNMVSSVYAITNLPLLFSPRLYLFHLMFDIPTINSPGTNIELAQKELTNGIFYKNLFLNKKNTLTSILVNIQPPSKSSIKNNQIFANLNYLKTQRRLTPKEYALWKKTKEIDNQNKLKRNQSLQKLLLNINNITDQYENMGKVYIVGMAAISQTIIDYLKADLFHFGISAFISMALILYAIFRQLNDAVLSLCASLVTVTLSMGIFSLFKWPLTIASANYPPILFVISLTFIIYIVLRFQEVSLRNKRLSQSKIIQTTVRELKTPIAYSCLTTMVGFLSLTLCDIQPIIDFGLMMSLSIPLAFIVCFTLLPAIKFNQKKAVLKDRIEPNWPNKFVSITSNNKRTIILTALASILFFGWGTQYITVENRFVDYFTSDTDMVKSIKLIDNELAGTSTLDILLEYPSKNYWIQKEGLDQIRQLDHFLTKQPGVRKVLSIDTVVQLLEGVHGSVLGPKLLKLSLNSIPKNDKAVLMDPYLAKNGALARVVVYLPDSDTKLNRDQLITDIETYLDQHMNPKVHHDVTGLYWLYNNVLQSLLNAQISILFWVYTIIGVILLVLFRDPRLMLCALIPNIIPMCMVFGTLGWLSIPLDFMTMTIAGISLGLAIDFAIQFIYRFKKELASHPFNQALLITYKSIGYAIITTTVTLIVGFSVMLFSHFKPLVYFSLLSGLSIGVACISTLMLLPILLSASFKKQA